MLIARDLLYSHIYIKFQINVTIYNIQNKANLIPDSDSSLQDNSNKLNFVQIRSLAAEKLIVGDIYKKMIVRVTSISDDHFSAASDRI